MKSRLFKHIVLLRGKRDYYLYKSDIQQENRKSCILFLIANFITQTAVMVSRIALEKNILLFSFSLTGTIYALLLLLIMPKVIKEIPSKWILPTLYIIQIPTFIIAILNGCIYIGDSYAFSFYILSFILPLFVFDLPLRVISIQTVYCLIFLVVDYFSKSLETFAIDSVHLLVTYSAIVSAILLILSLRFSNLENYVSVREKSEHHEVTGLKNRYALKKNSKDFLNKDMIVCMIDIDDFKFFNDMYGHNVGDIILRDLGDILILNFGADSCFNYGGDEFLIAYPGSNAYRFKELLEKTMNDLKNLQISETFMLHPTFSAGFVYGNVKTEQEFQEMINSADFTLYNAKSEGKNVICQKAFMKNSYKNEFMREGKASNNIDSLTKLMTFQSYLQNGQRYLEELKEKKDILICHINILNFKVFNSTLGYEYGDSLLLKVAELLKKYFPLSLISRIVDDHFSLVCEEKDFAASFKKVEDEFIAFSKNAAVRIIAGCALLKEDMNIRQGNDLAKIACDYIKEKPEVNYHYYDDKMARKNKISQCILTSFSSAIENHEIVVYYQPILQTVSSSISSLEALARWKHPSKGLIPPSDFISVLEENRLISKLDLYVLEEVCKKDSILLKKGISPLPTSINLSRFDFEREDIVETIIEIVDKYSIPHDLIILEITESTFLTEKEILKKAVKKLQDASFKIWMDDFGSEYSSLNLLKEFSFDVIKLDMKFLPKGSNRDKGRAIIDSIIEMGMKLSIGTLMEGVETVEEYTFIKNIGCEYIQGYLISKPLPADEIYSFLETKKEYLPHSKKEIQYYKELESLSLTSASLDSKTFDLSMEFGRVGIGIIECKDGYIRFMKGDAIFQEYLNSHKREELLESNLFHPRWIKIDEGLTADFVKSMSGNSWVRRDVGNGYCLFFHPFKENPTSHAESFIVLARNTPTRGR